MKKRKVSSEAVYIAGTIITALGTALLAKADLGMSMLVAPSYIISLKVTSLTFGEIGNIIQGIIFLILCLVLKKIKLMYLFSFISGVLFGTILDVWRIIISILSTQERGSFENPMCMRILLLVSGFLLNSMGVTLYFKTYLYPQVYEFFVKRISEKFCVRLYRVKMRMDIIGLLVSIIMSFLLFRELRGIGVGTVLIAFLNSIFIRWYDKIIDKYIEIYPRWKKFAEKFEDNNERK